MKKKKDVLFLCQFFYPEYISSALLPFETALALKEQGFSVGALCGYPMEYSSGTDVPLREQVDGVDIHRLKYIQLDRSGFLGRLVNYFSFTFMVLLHLGEIAASRCVVVYSNPPILPWIASWAKALFGTKLVFVAYDLYPEVATVMGTLGKGNPICRLMEHINKVVFRRADKIVALSGQMKDYILKNRCVPEDRVVVIPNWYPEEEIREPEENPFRQAAKGRFTVSYFGNMGTMQDMHTILDTIRLLKNDPDFFFLFAGHGNKMQTLKRIVEEEEIENIEIHGFLRGKIFKAALSASSAALISLEKGVTGLCVPSKTYCYMMQGLPLIAIMDECDIVRDIQAGAGVWVKNGQAAALAQALRAMRSDPAAAARMGSTSRELYEKKYTRTGCTRQYVDLFRELLD